MQVGSHDPKLSSRIMLEVVVIIYSWLYFDPWIRLGDAGDRKGVLSPHVDETKLLERLGGLRLRCGVRRGFVRVCDVKKRLANIIVMHAHTQARGRDALWSYWSAFRYVHTPPHMRVCVRAGACVATFSVLKAVVVNASVTPLPPPPIYFCPAPSWPFLIEEGRMTPHTSPLILFILWISVYPPFSVHLFVIFTHSGCAKWAVLEADGIKIRLCSPALSSCSFAIEIRLLKYADQFSMSDCSGTSFILDVATVSRISHRLLY